MSFLSTIEPVIKKINPYAGIVEDGGFIGGDCEDFFDTGSYILNAVISTSLFGGFPAKVIGLAGDQATGKTFFTIGAIKTFLDRNPNAGVVYFESEGAIGRKLLKERGVDTKRVLGISVVTVEDFRIQALKILNAFLALPKAEQETQPLMFVLDSLGNLSTIKEMNDVQEGNNVRDMTRSQVIKGAFRVLTLKLGLAKIPCLVTNHTYAIIGANQPTKDVSGGSGLKYAASIILMLSKRKDKEGDEVVGNIIHVKNLKNRLAKENAQVDVQLDYRYGLSRYYGLLALAVESGVFKKIGNKVEVPYKWLKANKEEDIKAALQEVGFTKKELEGLQTQPVCETKLLGGVIATRYYLETKNSSKERTVAYSANGELVLVNPEFESAIEKQEETVFCQRVLELLDEEAKKKFSYGLNMEVAGVSEEEETEVQDE